MNVKIQEYLNKIMDGANQKAIMQEAKKNLSDKDYNILKVFVNIRGEAISGIQEYNKNR